MSRFNRYPDDRRHMARVACQLLRLREARRAIVDPLERSGSDPDYYLTGWDLDEALEGVHVPSYPPDAFTDPPWLPALVGDARASAQREVADEMAAGAVERRRREHMDEMRRAAVWNTPREEPARRPPRPAVVSGTVECPWETISGDGACPDCWRATCRCAKAA